MKCFDEYMDRVGARFAAMHMAKISNQKKMEKVYGVEKYWKRL